MALAAIALVLIGVPTIVFQSRLRLELAMLVEVVTSATTLILVVVVTTADLGFSAVCSRPSAARSSESRPASSSRPGSPGPAVVRRRRGAPSNEGRSPSGSS